MPVAERKITRSVTRLSAKSQQKPSLIDSLNRVKTDESSVDFFYRLHLEEQKSHEMRVSRKLSDYNSALTPHEREVQFWVNKLYVQMQTQIDQ